MSELTYTTEKRDIGLLMDQINKQYFTVGKHLQEFLLSQKQEEGKELKTIREYMESQRAFVWEGWRSSNLIQSVLLKNPIPEITVYRADDKSQFRKTVDGQQRLTTIYLFINNQFKLDMSKTMFPEFKIEGETFKASEALQGKTFSQLPELWQDIIKLYQLRITTMNNCSEEDAEKAFVQMNSGAKGLKASEIRKAAMGIHTRRFFAEILESDWVLHALTALATKGTTGDEIISQIITLLHNGKAVELSKDNINDVIYSYREAGVPEQIKEDINNICDYLNRVTEIWIANKKKADEAQGTKKGKRVKNYSTYRFPWLNKTNTVMLMYSAYKALQSDLDVQKFATWAFNFFQNPITGYREGSQEKAIDLKRVEIRLNIIKEEIKRISPVQEIQEINTKSETESPLTLIKDNNWEQPQRIQTLESDITPTNEESNEETQSEQPEQINLSEEDQEGAKVILDIINNVA